MFKWKQIGITVIICQSVILMSAYFFERSVGIETFINGNFYIGLILLMAGLFIMVSKNGFFDVITNGIRHIFFRRQMEDDPEGFRSFSALMNFSSDWLIGTGGILLGISIICLIFVL